MKQVSSTGSNEIIYESIRKIAAHKIFDKNGVLRDSGKIIGEVVKIHDKKNDHDDENGDLYGTIDVQEYNLTEEDKQVDESQQIGLHVGVKLSAIQDNSKGILIVPTLHSDVVIIMDPITKDEYVILYSHADNIQIRSHKNTEIGVTETKEWLANEDSPDVEELEETGKYSKTSYGVDSILNTSVSGDDESKKSTLEINSEKIEAKHDKADFIADAQKLLAKYDAKEIVIKSDGVYVGSESASEPAVLGMQLANLMSEWLSAMSSMLTTTSMGPQPPINVAQFASLQAKVNTYKGALTGFLSKTVKISN